MRSLRDFLCPTHGAWEELTRREEAECAECGLTCPSVRLSAPKLRLDGTDPGFPRAWRRWADAHERHDINRGKYE